MGSIIGHEIIHGFDSEGRYYNSEGNNFNWWDNSTNEKFDEMESCLAKQYDAIDTKATKTSPTRRHRHKKFQVSKK